MGTESNKFFIAAQSEAASKNFLILLEVKLTQTPNSLVTDISQRAIYFENIKSFPLG
jgi:multisubunit Na+/H+ antiporter MnhE subunit